MTPIGRRAILQRQLPGNRKKTLPGGIVSTWVSDLRNGRLAAAREPYSCKVRADWSRWIHPMRTLGNSSRCALSQPPSPTKSPHGDDVALEAAGYVRELVYVAVVLSECVEGIVRYFVPSNRRRRSTRGFHQERKRFPSRGIQTSHGAGTFSTDFQHPR